MTAFPAPDPDDAPDRFDGPVAPGAHDPIEAPGLPPATRPAGRKLYADLDDDGLLPDVEPTPLPQDATNPLDRLRAEFAKAADDTKPEPRTWQVDARPGWAATFEVAIDEQTIKNYRRRCVMPGRRSLAGEPEINEVKLGLLLAAHYNIGIEYLGTKVLDNDGDPMRYRSLEFLSVAGVPTTKGAAIDAVRKWYVTDGAIIALSRALVNASGWSDDATELDEVAGPLDR